MAGCLAGRSGPTGKRAIAARIGSLHFLSIGEPAFVCTPIVGALHMSAAFERKKGGRQKRLGKLAADFFARVLELNYYECFVSDQASVFAFWNGDSNEALFDRIKDLYGADVSDIENGNIVEILERLRSFGAD